MNGVLKGLKVLHIGLKVATFDWGDIPELIRDF